MSGRVGFWRSGVMPENIGTNRCICCSIKLRLATINVLFLVHRLNEEFDLGTEETFPNILKVAFIVVNNNLFRNTFITVLRHFTQSFNHIYVVYFQIYSYISYVYFLI